MTAGNTRLPEGQFHLGSDGIQTTLLQVRDHLENTSHQHATCKHEPDADIYFIKLFSDQYFSNKDAVLCCLMSNFLKIQHTKIIKIG